MKKILNYLKLKLGPHLDAREQVIKLLQEMRKQELRKMLKTLDVSFTHDMGAIELRELAKKELIPLDVEIDPLASLTRKELINELWKHEIPFNYGDTARVLRKKLNESY